jgi:amino acid transporter
MPAGIVTMPRAGGDYIWQSRLLNGALGFVVSSTGLWFILWLWAPIYGTILSEALFQPAAVDFGHLGAAHWFASSNGRFVASWGTGRRGPSPFRLGGPCSPSDPPVRAYRQLRY